MTEDIAKTKARCHWCNLDNPLYVAYHDTEWGVPVHDDRKLFEMLLLECFQAVVFRGNVFSRSERLSGEHLTALTISRWRNTMQGNWRLCAMTRALCGTG